MEILDPTTGERKAGVASDRELAPPVSPRRTVQARVPDRVLAALTEPVVCWIEFSPRPRGLPGQIEIQAQCPAPFYRATKRAARRFRFHRYEPTEADPIYLHRMEFGPLSEPES